MICSSNAGFILVLALAAGLTSPTLAAAAQPAGPESRPSRAFGEPDRPTNSPRLHDPSRIIRCGDVYWLFSTGTGLLAWRSADGILWQPGPKPLPDVPGWVREFLPGQRGHFWAPDVVRVNGRYLLYYSVSTWGRNTSAIALATNPTLDPDDLAFAWRDEGIILRSSGDDDFNAIDPALLVDKDGRLWMALGSFWSGIKLVELNPTTGSRIAPDSPIHSIASHPQIEAPELVRHRGDYFLFVNWGFCCRGTNSTYSIRVGRSDCVTGPYRDREGRSLLDGGGCAFLETEGRFIGPGHAAVFEDGTDAWVSFHFYDGERRGRSTLGIRQLQWDAEGWPVAGPWAPLPPP